MKKISYECNRCGRQIGDTELYQLCIERLDPNDEAIIDKPVPIQDLEYENLADMHLCEACLMAVVTNLRKELAEEVAEPSKRLAKALFGKIATENAPAEPDKHDITEAELRKLLVDERRSIREIADMYGYTYMQIWHRAEKWGLIVKSPKKKEKEPVKEKVWETSAPSTSAENKSTVIHEVPEKPERLIMDVESVKEDYYVNKMTVPDIAKKYGVVVQSVISFMVKNHIGKQSNEVAAYMRQHGKTDDRGY